jgi:hypothetical protein
MSTAALDVTALVVIVKVADACPADTVRLAGTFAFVWLLVKLTSAPPASAPVVNVTVPVTGFPPTTEVTGSVTELRATVPAVQCSLTQRNP